MSVPSLERAIELLFLLESSPGGLNAQSLLARSKIPRATLFRILKVLSHHGLVQQHSEIEGLYRLGPAIARLSEQVQIARDLVTVASPFMASLSRDVGETIKLVVRDDVEAVTVAVSRSPLEGSVSSVVGTRVPLHLGTSQRLLLSRAPQSVVQQVLEGSLEKSIPNTFVDPIWLQSNLLQLRKKNSASGAGDGLTGIGAAAALINNVEGVAIAALAAVYIAPAKSNQEVKSILRAVEQCALNISALKPSI